MRIGGIALAFFVVTLTSTPAAGPALDGWGELADPDGDCAARVDDARRLVIDVPSKLHDLWPEASGTVNAPRVMQDADGDVTVRVTAAGDVTAKDGTGVAADKRPFRAATLLLWQDEKNFVRLDRGCVVREGKAIHFAYFHVFKDGKRTTHLSKDFANRPTLLKLERRGKKVLAAVSQDGGATWQTFDEQDV